MEAMEVREAMATLNQNQKFLWMDQMGGILFQTQSRKTVFCCSHKKYK